MYIQTREFYFTHYGYYGNNYMNVYATMEPFGESYYGGRYPITTSPDYIRRHRVNGVSVIYDCSRIPKQYSHAYVHIKLSNGDEFRYLKQCHPIENSFWIKIFQSILSILTASIIVFVGVWVQKLDSFQRNNQIRLGYDSTKVTNVTLFFVFLTILSVAVDNLIYISAFVFVSTICL